MKKIIIVAPIILALFLSACGGGSSSGSGKDRSANNCVTTRISGDNVIVRNSCDNDIYVRFFGNETPAFLVRKKSSVTRPRSLTSGLIAACDAPYKPRTGKKDGEFFCEK